jgi:hypothetical protein
MGAATSEGLANTPDAESAKRKFRFEYMRVKSDPSAKNLEVISAVLAVTQRPQLTPVELSQETVNILQKQYRLRWAMIGLRTRMDGKYRYEVQTGMREDAWTRQKAKTYALADFMETSERYKFGEISKLTRFYPEEENPLFNDDQLLTNRPVLLKSRRSSDDETLEADFIDTLIMGPGNDLLGWIEYSGTTVNRLPDATVIRGIEVVAGVLALAMTGTGMKARL